MTWGRYLYYGPFVKGTQRPPMELWYCYNTLNCLQYIHDRRLNLALVVSYTVNVKSVWCRILTILLLYAISVCILSIYRGFIWHDCGHRTIITMVKLGLDFALTNKILVFPSWARYGVSFVSTAMKKDYDISTQLYTCKTQQGTSGRQAMLCILSFLEKHPDAINADRWTRLAYSDIVIETDTPRNVFYPCI